MSLKSAKQAVAIIISAYRMPNGVIEEVFAELAAQALAEYSDETLQRLIDPRTGPIRKWKFRPSIAEMIEFCEEIKNPPIHKGNRWGKAPDEMNPQELAEFLADLREKQQNERNEKHEGRTNLQ